MTVKVRVIPRISLQRTISYMFGSRLLQKLTGDRIPTVNGFIQQADGCGFQTTTGAGRVIITADGGNQQTTAGYGCRVMFGLLHGSSGGLRRIKLVGLRLPPEPSGNGRKVFQPQIMNTEILITSGCLSGKKNLRIILLTQTSFLLTKTLTL